MSAEGPKFDKDLPTLNPEEAKKLGVGFPSDGKDRSPKSFAPTVSAPKPTGYTPTPIITKKLELEGIQPETLQPNEQNSTVPKKSNTGFIITGIAAAIAAAGGVAAYKSLSKEPAPVASASASASEPAPINKKRVLEKGHRCMENPEKKVANPKDSKSLYEAIGPKGLNIVADQTDFQTAENRNFAAIKFVLDEKENNDANDDLQCYHWEAVKPNSTTKVSAADNFAIIATEDRIPNLKHAQQGGAKVLHTQYPGDTLITYHYINCEEDRPGANRSLVKIAGMLGNQTMTYYSFNIVNCSRTENPKTLGGEDSTEKAE